MDTSAIMDSPGILGIITGLFLLSELLAAVPQIKANSVFQLASAILSEIVRKKSAPVLAALCVLSLVACKSGDIKKVSQKMLKIKGDAQLVLIEGCEAVPSIMAVTSTIKEFLPDGHDVSKGVEVGQDFAAKICERVQPKKEG